MNHGTAQLRLWQAIAAVLALALLGVLLALPAPQGDPASRLEQPAVDEAYRRVALLSRQQPAAIRARFYPVIARGGGEFCVELRAKRRRDPGIFGFCFSDHERNPRSERDSPGVF